MNIDLHVHTNYSYDGYLSLRKLDDASYRSKIDAVAITDHNEIAGGVAGANLYVRGALRTRIVVGEEVKTIQGAITGLFLKERIPGGMSLADTIKAIRAQRGLVYLPHPFGYERRSDQLSFEALDNLWDKIDIVEIFNGRNWNYRDNALAAELASKHNKPGGVGSDAHFAWEVGRSFAHMPNFDGPGTFLASIRQASYVLRPCPFLCRVFFKIYKRVADRPLPHNHTLEEHLPT